MASRSPSSVRASKGVRSKQRYKKFKAHSNPYATPAWRNRQTDEVARRLKRMGPEWA